MNNKHRYYNQPHSISEPNWKSYIAKTTGKQYDHHPLIACTDLFRWGFRGINFHWQSSRNYTWEELTGQVYMVKSIELDDLLAIPYAKFITK